MSRAYGKYTKVRKDILVMNKIKRGIGERMFEVINILIMCCLCVVMLYPMIHVLCASFSSPQFMSGHKGILLWPKEFTVNAYKLMARNPMILKGYINTLTILVFGVTLNIVLTSMGAYVLSRKSFAMRNKIMMMIVFTMYFSGGIIPFYFTVRTLGMENSLLALILPSAISTYNVIIMRTSFLSIPDSLEESARLDGAGHFVILFKIVMPLSKAVIAVMILYYAVGHWNSWFNAMLFLSDRKKFPLQLILREILIQNDTSAMVQNVGIGEQGLIGETVKYAVIIVSTVPILCIYPFIQKYFEKGVMIGAVKG